MKRQLITLIISLITISYSLKAQLNADFSASQLEGCGNIAGLQLTDLSTSTATQWNWNFGNGATSTLQNPSLNYTSPGSYTVTLIVSDGNGNTATETKVDYIQVYNNPTADYSFSPNSGCPPLAVQFTDNSAIGDAPITDYNWDFGDGSPVGTGSNPVHLYQTAGTYAPSLEVVDANGCRNSIQKNTINVTDAPIAAFSSPNAVNCGVPHAVDFINNSTGSGPIYEWDFGDGATSSLVNPTHTYTNLGRYTVTLIATGPFCSDTLVENNFVKLESTVADFTFPKDTFCIGEDIQLINNSTGASLFSWNFGDGTTSTQENPTKTYSDSGNYTINLNIAAGSACLNQTQRTVYIQGVYADFIIDSSMFCSDTVDVTFTNQSTNASSFQWIIGGPDSSFFFNAPSFIFNQISEGVDSSYADTLIAISNIGCRDTLVVDSNRSIEILRTDIFINDTIKDRKDGCLPFSISFRDSTTGPEPYTSFNWKLGDGRTSNVRNPQNIVFTEDSSYLVTLTVENQAGCKSTSNVEIIGGNPQQPDLIFFPDTLCHKDTLFIKDRSTDDSLIDGTRYELLRNDLSIAFKTDPDTFFTAIPDTGNIKIKSTVFQNGCPADSTFEDSIYVRGPIVSEVNFQSDCNSRRLINFQSTIKGANRFKWIFEDTVAANTTDINPTYLFPADGVYQVLLIAYNDNNSCEPDTATTRIELFGPPTPVISPFQRNFCLGDTIKIRTSNSSQLSTKILRINGDSVSDNGGFNYITTESELLNVDLEGVDLVGCPANSQVQFYVSEITAGFDTIAYSSCLPLDIEFIDTSRSDTVIDKWFWVFAGGDTLKSDTERVVFTAPGAKSLYFKVENRLGCADSIQIENFTNPDALNVSFLVGSNEGCTGAEITFRNTSSGNNPAYSWDFGDGTVLTTNDIEVKHTYTVADNYTVSLTGTDAKGCSITEEKIDAVDIEETPVADFSGDNLFAPCPLPVLEVNFTDNSTGPVTDWLWDLGADGPSVIQNPVRRYVSVGSYDISLKVTTAYGCEDEVTKTGYINVQGPSADITVSASEVCLNEPITFQFTNPLDVNSFTWDFRDGVTSTQNPVTHTYTDTTGIIKPTIILSSSSNCDAPTELEVEVFEVIADFILSDDSACAPFEAQITNTSKGATSYNWNFGNGQTSTAQNPSSQLYDELGKYPISLSITSAIGCADSKTEVLEIFPVPSAETFPDTGLCFGNSIELIASGGTSYQWTPNTFLDRDDSSHVVSTPDTVINYMVYVANKAACVDSAEVRVSVQQPPVFSIPSDTSIYLGEEVGLNAFAGEGFTYQWSPVEGLSCSNCPNPVIQARSSQEYVVLIKDNFGCYEVRDTIKFDVTEAFSLDVPSAFSPNGDGNNDIIYVRGWGLKELLSFKIFNRFGQIVFESRDLKKGWDGTYNGQAQNVETYVYTVEALTFDEEVLTKKGNITLLR